MTSIKSFFNGRQILEAMRQKWWYFVINFIALFFSHPVAYLLIYDNSIRRDLLSSTQTNMRWVEQAVQDFFSLDSAIIPVMLVMVFSALFSSVVAFAYLHSRREVNFYHSLPVRRESWFVSNYIMGAAAFILPFLCNVIITLACAAATGMAGYIQWGVYGAAILTIILFYLLNYTIAVLAANLAGTVFSHICGALVLNFSVFFTVMIHYAMGSVFFTTFSSSAFEEMIGRLSVFVRGFSVIGMQLSMGEVGLYIALLVVMVALCIFLYKKRPSESSGSSLIFEKTKLPIQYLLVLWGTAYMGLFFYAVSGMGFMLFGFIMGGLLTHMACEVIFSKDFKAMFQHKVGLLIFLVVFSGCFSVYCYDLLGYDTYVPKASDVASVSFADGYRYTSMGYGNGYYIIKDETMKEYRFTQAADIEKIVRIAQLSVEYQAQSGRTNHDIRSNEYVVELSPQYYDTMQINVVYKLNSGRIVERFYHGIPVVAIQEAYEQVYNSEQYKKNNYGWLAENENGPIYVEVVSAINQSERMQGELSNNTMNAAQGRRLQEAIKHDIQARSYADLQTHRAVFSVSLHYGNPTNGEEPYAYDYYNVRDIEVFECDKETIAVLQADFGMQDPTKTFETLVNSIDRIVLLTDTMGSWEYTSMYMQPAAVEWGDQKVAPYFPEEIVFNDPVEIREIMRAAISPNYRFAGPVLSDGRARILLVMKEGMPDEVRAYYDMSREDETGGNIATLEYGMRLGKIPAFMEEHLE